MPKRILVIDDDEDILEILNIIFQNEGFEVVVSNTGETAEHLELIHPDLILLDVRIEGYRKRGNEICAEIRKHYPPEKLPVILLSAETDLDSLAAGCGANSFIKKPFDIAQLADTVKHLLMT
ncbi:response regulator transcription factor [Mucilaginibacter sp. HD30]